MRTFPASAFLVVAFSVFLAWGAPSASGADAILRDETFTAGNWDPSRWQALRLPHQTETPGMIQKEASLGTTSFTPRQKTAKLDNVLLMTDTGTGEGQFEVTFGIGSEKGTAPGFFLGPAVRDGVLRKGIAIFVATYTMAIWLVETDEEKNETKYTHLARMNRWSAPGEKHVFRCRYSKKRDSVAFQLDDSDVLMLRGTGCEINSSVGIWACHGTCDYYDFKVTSGGTLPWSAAAPAKK